VNNDLPAQALLQVEGLRCENCVRNLGRHVAALGAESEVNLVAGTATLRWNPETATLQQLLGAIDRAGYQATTLSVTGDQPPPPVLAHALLQVEGLRCENCVRHMTQAVNALGAQCDVNLVGGTADIRWEAGITALPEIMKAVRTAGYRPTVISAQLPDADAAQSGAEEAAVSEHDAADAAARAIRNERRTMLMRIGVAALFGMQVMMLAVSQYQSSEPIEPGIALLMRTAQWVMATPVLLFSAWPFLRSAALALRARAVTMDVPVALAMLLAYTASAVNVISRQGHVYFDSVVMFTLLLLVARWFEGNGRAEASRRLRELADAQPATAQRVSTDGTATVATIHLAAGDVVRVSAGEAIPADGQLLDADAELDEALLTGESLPVVKQPGAMVFAGSINVGRRAVDLQVTASGGATRLSLIRQLMNRAQSERPGIQRLADRLAGALVGLILVLAAISALLWWSHGPLKALQVALAVLVVTCPCALSLATPVAIAAASTALARRGVLLAQADGLLRIAEVSHLCLDKTGTVTTGRLRLAGVIVHGTEFDRERCMAIAAALEADVRHPVGRTLAALPTDLIAEQVDVTPGRGVSGLIKGREFRLGAMENDGPLTRVGLWSGDSLLASFDLAQQLRPEAAEALRRLRRHGLQTELLSGDAETAVADTAIRLGIEQWRSRQSPDDKLARIRELQRQGRRVWAVGDGINDAPVLAGADVSTAMAGGAALAQSRAQLLMTRDDLLLLPEILDLAHRARVVIRQNLAWAALYNLIAIPLAMSGHLNPWIASLGMGISSVAVVANALRLARGPRRAAPKLHWRAAT